MNFPWYRSEQDSPNCTVFPKPSETYSKPRWVVQKSGTIKIDRKGWPAPLYSLILLMYRLYIWTGSQAFLGPCLHVEYLLQQELLPFRLICALVSKAMSKGVGLVVPFYLCWWQQVSEWLNRAWFRIQTSSKHQWFHQNVTSSHWEVVGCERLPSWLCIVIVAAAVFGPKSPSADCVLHSYWHSPPISVGKQHWRK